MKIRIQKFVQRGLGLGRLLDGKVVLVSGALPGELVEAQVVKEKKDYLEAKTIKILESSPLRVEPLCPLYGICGGCNLMHLKHEAQISCKEKNLLAAIKRFGVLNENSDFVLEKSAVSAPFGYRSRARFAIQGQKAGFYAKGKKDFVEVQSCPVLLEPLNALLKNPSLLASFSQDGQTSVLMGQKPLLGKEKGTVSILGKNLWVSNGVFFQSNLGMLPQMINYVVSEVQGEKVLDLYSGIGTFSAFLEDDHEVTAVESNPLCLTLAQLFLKKTKFVLSSAESFRFPKPIDTIIADPPRTGMSPKTRAILPGLGAQRIIYVSCDMMTLCRDAKELSEGGYVLKKARIFDFFPQTWHCETVSVFQRRA